MELSKQTEAELWVWVLERISRYDCESIERLKQIGFRLLDQSQKSFFDKNIDVGLRKLLKAAFFAGHIHGQFYTLELTEIASIRHGRDGRRLPNF